MNSIIPVICAQDIMSLVRALPGSAAQGLIWGIMAIGVFITYKILNFADLTVDGTMGTGGAVTVMLILAGYEPVVAVAMALIAGMLAGLITGILTISASIPLLSKISLALTTSASKSPVTNILTSLPSFKVTALLISKV